jgi:hypothetical protein
MRRHLVGHVVVILACEIVAAVFGCSAAAQNESSAPGLKYCSIPSEVELGTYMIRTRGERLRITIREARAERERSLQRPDTIVDHVSYPADKVLAIALHDNSDYSVLQRLEKLSAIPRADIHHLAVSGTLNHDCLKTISEMTSLRQLVVDDSAYLEEEEACGLLDTMKDLEYLLVERVSERPFGSAAFCNAIVRMKKLRFLSFPADRLTNAQIQVIGNHPRLEVLNIHTTKPILSGKTLKAFQQLKELKQLTLACTEDLTSDDVNGFGSIQGLEILAIQTESNPAIVHSLRRKLPQCAIHIVSAQE